MTPLPYQPGTFSDWTPAERRAWKWPEKVAPSEWAERNRVLPAQMTSEPGPWRNPKTPYLAGIMDAVADPNVEEVVFIKSTQVGFSEAMRNIIGYWIDCEPGPCLLVMPDEKSAREAVDERIRPLLTHSPALAKHISARAWDNKQSVIHLDTMSIFVGWAGSPQSLASRPMRYVCFDEIDKYPPFAGREADPISLGTERTATYGPRKRIVKGSTPTTRDGAIWKAWESCGDRRHFHVPCPHCRHTQRLIWSQVKWPKIDEPDKVKLADDIQKNGLAWYECEKCKGRIEDSHKPRMLRGGKWISQTGTSSNRIGFHLSALYSPWRKFSDVAAQFVRADGDPGATMNFRNSWLAEPFENRVQDIKKNVVRDKAAMSGPPGSVPATASALIATADTQTDHFVYTIRWWSYGNKSGLVTHGYCQTFDELYRICLESRFQCGGNLIAPSHLLIDSGGNRTNEVYEFALRNPGQIVPTKGASHTMARPWSNSTQPNGLILRWVNTNHFKDMLARLINAPDQTQWLPHSAVDDDYCSQMASEHKVLERGQRDAKWKPKTDGAKNHFWDCEVLQCVAADMLALAHAPLIQQQQTPAPAPTERREQFASFGGARRW